MFRNPDSELFPNPYEKTTTETRPEHGERTALSSTALFLLNVLLTEAREEEMQDQENLN